MRFFSFYSVLFFLLLGAAGLVAQAPSSPLPTTFAGGNGQEGVMFEVNSLTGIIVDDFDVSFAGPVGDFEVWALNMPGTFLFNQSSNVNWTLLGTATNIASLGIGAATPLGLSLSFDLPAGMSQSFYITGINGTELSYTNGTGFGNVAASNLDLEILEGFGGTYFDLVFSPRIWNGRLHYSPRILVDVALAQLVNPQNDVVDCSLRSAAEPVTVLVRNQGLNTIPSGTSLTVSYILDGGAPVVEMVSLPNALNGGELFSHTFLTTADLSAQGSHNLRVDVQLVGDLNANNDAVTEFIGSGGQLRVDTYPYREDFSLSSLSGSNVLPLGWLQEPGDATGVSADWYVRDDDIPGGWSGPTQGRTYFGSTDLGFAYIRDDGDHASVSMRSPCFDLSTLANPNCRFFLYSDNPTGAGDDTLLSVDVISYPSGVVTADVFGPGPSLSNGWQMQEIDLSSFAGQLIQLIFRVDTTGSVFGQHDLAIDDFTLGEHVVGLGQSPVQNFGRLIINEPFTANWDYLAFGLDGPYFARANIGEGIVFQIFGWPMQPIIMFTGALNPGAALIPNVGSIDAGGAVGPTGIPGGLILLADGSAMGGLNSFFVTDSSSNMEIGFSVPNIPPGVLGTFQCVIPKFNGMGLQLTNAVQVTVN